jgi:hypothetical protein
MKEEKECELIDVGVFVHWSCDCYECTCCDDCSDH